MQAATSGEFPVIAVFLTNTRVFSKTRTTPPESVWFPRGKPGWRSCRRSVGGFSFDTP